MYISEIEELMDQFDHELNDTLDPSTITHGSHIKIWWRCDRGPDHVFCRTRDRSRDQK